MRWIALGIVLSILLTLTFSSRPPVVVKKSSRIYTYYLPMVLNQKEVSKKGAGMPYPICNDAAQLKVQWLYDWSNNPPICPGIESISMAWGSFPTTVGGDSDWLMGFNEPDLAGQANLTPLQAAREWKRIENAYPGKKLVAPVPSMGNKQWLVDFRNTYISEFGQPPRLNALAEHCYQWGDWSPTQTCINESNWYFARMAEWNVPQLWVTEWAFFACIGYSSQSQVTSEMNLFINWMNQESRISRYAWFGSRIYGTEPWSFGVCSQSLTTPTGTLAPLGTIYSGVK